MILHLRLPAGQYGFIERVLKKRSFPDHGFRHRFNLADTILLAEMDALHDTLSGPATKKCREQISPVGCSFPTVHDTSSGNRSN